MFFGHGSIVDNRRKLKTSEYFKTFRMLIFYNDEDILSRIRVSRAYKLFFELLTMMILMIV